MPNQRIRWTDSEKDIVAKKAAELVVQKHYNDLPALREAQSLLPVERQRNIMTLMAVPWFKPLLDKCVVELKKQPDIKIVEKEIFTPIKLNEVSTEELLGEFFRRMFKTELKELFDRCHAAVANVIVQNLQPPKSEPVQGLKKILIVGLLAGQSAEIVTEFEKCFKLAFWKEGSTTSLRMNAQNSDKVFVMRKFISHSDENIVKTTGTSYSLINGGMSDLRKSLEYYYVNGGDPK